jgi:hypothetical protein
MRGHLWCFTDFLEKNVVSGYSEHPDIRAIAWAIENCPKTDRLHNQGFIQVYEKLGIKQIQKLLDSKCHLECIRGSIKDNESYCSKSSDLKCIGEFVTKGERVDLQCFYELVKDNNDYQLLEMGYASEFIRNHNAIGKIRTILLKEEAKKLSWRKLNIVILLGKAGCGKSRYVRSKSPGVFTVDCEQSFLFDGYEGENEILIDDFNGCIKYNYLLRMLDGHPLPLNVKFGRSHAIYRTVYITTNVHPLHWYSKCRDNLKRRCPRLLLGNTNQENEFSIVENFWEDEELVKLYRGEYV